MALAIGRFLRGVIDGRLPTMVTIEEEIEWLKNYLVIEQLRFADRLRLRWAIDPAALQLMVPAMILQPLVENAMTHGVAQTSEPTLVEIVVERHEQRLRIIIRNRSDSPLQPSTPGTGQGLQLIRDVLTVAYGTDVELANTALIDGYEVRIAAPARVADD